MPPPYISEHLRTKECAVTISLRTITSIFLTAYQVILRLFWRLHPNKALVYAARAGIEHERGLLELALYDYEEAIKRDNKNTEYYIFKVEVLIDLKRYDEAMRELNQLTRMGVPRTELGELYKKCKKR